jgi:hypothetical protein
MIPTADRASRRDIVRKVANSPTTIECCHSLHAPHWQSAVSRTASAPRIILESFLIVIVLIVWLLSKLMG